MVPIVATEVGTDAPTNTTINALIKMIECNRLGITTAPSSKSGSSLLDQRIAIDPTPPRERVGDHRSPLTQPVPRLIMYSPPSSPRSPSLYIATEERTG